MQSDFLPQQKKGGKQNLCDTKNERTHFRDIYFLPQNFTDPYSRSPKNLAVKKKRNRSFAKITDP